MGETGIYTYYNNSSLSHSEKTSLIALSTTIWKSFLIPLDTLSNIYQVKGLESNILIKNKIKNFGFVKTYYSGASLYLSNMFISSYLWFNFYIIFDRNFPKNLNKDVRNASIGFICTLISDVTLNPKIILKRINKVPLFTLPMDSFKKLFWTKELKIIWEED